MLWVESGRLVDFEKETVRRKNFSIEICRDSRRPYLGQATIHRALFVKFVIEMKTDL